MLDSYGEELAVAGWGLPWTRRGLYASPLDEARWEALVQGVRRQGIWGMLQAAVAAGALPCTAGQAEQVRMSAGRAAIDDMRVDARLVQTSDLLHGAGIKHRVLKGSTTALRVYPVGGLRSYGDVDVLVEGSSFDASVRLLEQSGGRRRYPQAQPGFDQRFSKGTSFSMPDGVPVDLHRTFVLGPYGFTVDLAGIFSRSDVVTVAGRQITCLELVDAAVHACLHAALGDWPPRLVPMRDVVQFVSDERIDPDALLDRAREWRCLAVVARAVALAQGAYGLPDSSLTRWSAGYRPKRWEHRTIALYGEGHSYRRQSIAAARFVPGVQAKVTYVRALAFPSSAYLHEREGSLVRRGLRALGVSDPAGSALSCVGPDLEVRAYLGSRRAFYGSLTLVRACFDGLWLGLLDRDQCDAIDRRYYDGEQRYADPAYNQAGLWPWEGDDIDAEFHHCRRLAVLGAGGGREVVALRRRGFEVDGFECHEGLLAAGNQLLGLLDLAPPMSLMPRDRWPPTAGSYDGVVIGWGAYMLIPDRGDRVELLRAVRAHVPDDGPVLLSFFVRGDGSRYFSLTAQVANLLRRARRRDPVGVGASLRPNRVQFFTIAEVVAELAEAGFSLARHGTDEYGHAVGRALPRPPR